jgi:epoxyqueuosine reductase
VINSVDQHTESIKSAALEAGFDAVGIAPPDISPEEQHFFSEWLDSGFHAGMGYMERNVEKRRHPEKLFPGVKSVIVLLKSYHRNELPDMPHKVSRYALGRDYHKRLKKRMKRLQASIQVIIGREFRSRPFTDSAPVFERSLAVKAGLGKLGKNTCLIHPQLGSFVFIAELFTDIELTFDQPSNRTICGRCTRCIDACPTHAISSEGVNSERCISYHTIETQNDIPEWIQDKLNGWVFGCDICQEVCPYNKKPLPVRDPDFMPGPHLEKITAGYLSGITDEDFVRVFCGTPMMRTGRDKLLRNIKAAEK